MRYSRVWQVIHALFTVSLIGLCGFLLGRDRNRPQLGPEPDSAHADRHLRWFLDVKRMGGDYELPPGEEHCAVALLQFENGKFRRREHGYAHSCPPGGSRVVPYFVMWGPQPDGKSRVIYGTDYLFLCRFENSSFHAALDTGGLRSLGTPEEVRGWRVIEFAISAKPREGKALNQSVYDSAAAAIENCETVLVMGLKPFPTEKQAKEYLNTDEPADP